MIQVIKNQVVSFSRTFLLLSGDLADSLAGFAGEDLGVEAVIRLKKARRWFGKDGEL